MRKMHAAILALLLLSALALPFPHRAAAVVDDRVDLNNAEAEEFERFADILEEVDVETILQARVDRGDFKTVEEIVPLIGLDKFTEIQDDVYVTVTRERKREPGTADLLSGSARVEVRDRSVNEASPLIKSRTNYDNGPEFRKEFELASGDAFEGYMRLKRSSWMRTNSEYVYDRRAAFNTWDTVKVAKKRVRRVKQMSFVEGAEAGAEGTPEEAAEEGRDGQEAPLEPAPVPPAEEPVAEGPAAEDTEAQEEQEPDGAATDGEEAGEEEEAEGAEEPHVPPACFTAEFLSGRGTAQVILVKDRRLFSDATGEIELEIRVEANRPESAPATLYDVETADGQAKFGIRLVPAVAVPGEAATRATAETALAALPAPPAATAEATLAASPVATDVPAATAETALAPPPLPETAGTLPVEVATPSADTQPVTLQGNAANTLPVELSASASPAPAAEGEPAGTAPVLLIAPASSPAPATLLFTLSRVSGGRAEDELLHRILPLGTSETALRHILRVRANSGSPEGAPLALRILRSRTKDGVVSIRVAFRPGSAGSMETESAVPDALAASPAEATEEERIESGAPDKKEKAKKKKRASKKKKSPKRKKAEKAGDGLEFTPSRVAKVERERTVEVSFADKRVLRRRLELGNVTMAPVRKPLLAYTSTLYKRGAKYYMAGDGVRDTLIYAHMTDENMRLYGNHVEFDLPGGGVAGSQLYRVEAATEAKRFTNLNLYGEKKVGDTTLYGEYGRVPGGADALYVKSDTRLKKMSFYSVFNAIEPAYGDEEAADPFSMTRFQEYSSAYLKALWRPDRAVSVTAKKTLYERGEVDLQNGATRNATDTLYFRYLVSPALTLRADLYRTVSSGAKEGNYVRFKSLWKATDALRLESSHKYYDYNAASGSSANKNSQHSLYGAYTVKKGLVVKAKGDRQNQDDRDVFTNSAGFEWKTGRSHYFEFETENERIRGKLVPTVQIETEVKGKYVYSF